MRVSPLSIDIPDHIQRLTAAEGTDVRGIRGENMVAISSVRFTELSDGSYDNVRFIASLKASTAYNEAGVLQIVMVDPASDPRVGKQFADVGAIVVYTPEGRSGLATPYLDAAQLVRLWAGPQAGVLKAEADKRLTSYDLSAIEGALRHNDVVIGDRTERCMTSMSPIQEFCERTIDATLVELLDIPHGACSGVQAYTRRGLTTFLEYGHLIEQGQLDNGWKYLLYTPATAAKNRLNVDSVLLNFRYDAEMVKAERSNPALTLKRLEQFATMVTGAFEVWSVIHGDKDHSYQPPTNARFKAMLAQLAALRNAVIS